MTELLSPPKETAETAALLKPKRKLSPRFLIPLGLLVLKAKSQLKLAQTNRDRYARLIA